MYSLEHVVYLLTVFLSYYPIYPHKKLHYAAAKSAHIEEFSIISYFIESKRSSIS